MATNAPYYQLRGQFSNGTNAPFATADEDEYDLTASLAPHNAALYVDTQTADPQHTTLEENHNLVELLEAATTAAGQAASAMNVDTPDEPVSSHQNIGKRKRGGSPSDRDADDSAAPKRARIDIPTDPKLNTPGSVTQMSSEHANVGIVGDSPLHGAHTSGVHSAAALFRRSSERTTRKYTRPPMSKLFISLQLTPENFLHLQAKAKSYMLDVAHPERQSCVGNRGKGDTDMVKLRLFNCVRDFLKDGVGEQFFGENVEKPAEVETMEAARVLGEDKIPEERLVWPKDATKIISLVTPLLRRMVTNERQRMYAIETRKGGKKKEGGLDSAQQGAPETNSPHNGHSLAIPQDDIPIHTSGSASPDLSDSMHISHSGQNTQMSLAASPSSIQFIANGERLDSQQMQDQDILPVHDHAYDLRTINIQLAKNNSKLKGFKQVKLPDVDPARYSWERLQIDLKHLLWHAVATYPALRSGGNMYAVEGMGPEALRGLAVAATEFQKLTSQNKTVSVESHTSSQVRQGELSPSLSHHLVAASNIHNVDLESAAFVPELMQLAPPKTSAEPLSDRNEDTTSPLASLSHQRLGPISIGSHEDKIARRSHSCPSESRSALGEDITENPTTQTIDDGSQANVLSPGGMRHNDAHPPFRPPDPPSPSFGNTQEATRLSNGPSTLPVLPDYSIQVILTSGLTEIKDADGWNKAKEHVAYAVWSNGTMSVVVELL